jgi:ribosomal protein S18 acetylase RimI-like enzyme
MDSKTSIRKIGREEISTIITLANDIWPETYKNILSPEQIAYMMKLMYSYESLENQVSEKGHKFVIVEADKEPIAFASYGESDKAGIFKLHKIYVSQALHGKGIGKMIIDFIVSDIIGFASGLELNVNRNNSAKGFYEKLGFKVVGREDIDIGNGFLMNDYVMRLDIHNS